ncbi:NfeD family protein [Dermatophilus congolensis]|uniref:NfeD-like C-terminal, partner-binding n=1 Tax=Dermatophilus congolensis TaxID=1863 RepID=A0A239VN51_9MICO|nr:NfeD family protein [Dermatophilus congolensis]MBO3129453.1 NfeD family protein [Dermatophilus congolensis]MBO3131914.1 NfeD family protein [Dermatophilus congolensis]MBO3133929.1 NfeD family protein [Dermatophilus congolensis]MBO3136160.1 NfeD family protein [Dermatophilus congolensis]MBO3138404.1 NfeD family protein [Dermatophilus congolensis]
MGNLPEWLIHNAWAAWLGAALILAGVELASADFVFLMLAAGAFAASMTAFVAGFPGQVVVFAVVAVSLIFTVRPVLKQRFLASLPQFASGKEAYMGRLGVVVEEVTDCAGQVKVDGEVWSARWAEGARVLPGAVGAWVQVSEVDGVTLLVVPHTGPQDVVSGAGG